MKAELKQRKEEVRVMVEEMEKMGRDLASREYFPFHFGCPHVAKSIQQLRYRREKKCLLNISISRLQEYPTADDTTFDSPRINSEP